MSVQLKNNRVGSSEDHNGDGREHVTIQGDWGMYCFYLALH